MQGYVTKSVRKGRANGTFAHWMLSACDTPGKGAGAGTQLGIKK